MSKSVQILTADETRYKLCKFRENRLRDTPLQAFIFRNFVKFQ